MRPRLPSLANPVQASALAEIMALTPLAQRLPVAAAYLETTSAELCRLAGVTYRHRHYYSGNEIARGGKSVGAHLPFLIMRDLADIIGVPFHVLWDDEAREDPLRVVQGGYVAKPHLKGLRRQHLEKFRGRPKCA